MNTRRTVLVTVSALAAVVAAGGGGANAFVEHEAQQRATEAVRAELGDSASGVHAELTDPLAGLKTLTGRVGTVHISADEVRREGGRPSPWTRPCTACPPTAARTRGRPPSRWVTTNWPSSCPSRCGT
ncbi:hypothetical protein IHE61_20040 [Streptomyces sp. GKU 257-1]|nr:hypothetical protein [Streptomyces sp. GKU 257-1]